MERKKSSNIPSRSDLVDKYPNVSGADCGDQWDSPTSDGQNDSVNAEFEMLPYNKNNESKSNSSQQYDEERCSLLSNEERCSRLVEIKSIKEPASSEVSIQHSEQFHFVDEKTDEQASLNALTTTESCPSYSQNSPGNSSFIRENGENNSLGSHDRRTAYERSSKGLHTIINLDANSDQYMSDQEIPTSPSFLLEKSSGSVHFRSPNGSCLRGGSKGGSNSTGPHVQFETPTPSQDDLFDQSTEYLGSKDSRNLPSETKDQGISFSKPFTFGKRKKRQRHISGSSTTSVGSSASVGSDASELQRKAPDGGWGWVVVAASFFVHCIADGVTMSFGVLFIEFLAVFKESKSFTSWVGSLFMAIPLLAGPLASMLTDHFGCRQVTIVGSVIASIGFLLSAFSNSILVLLFTLGLITGLGLAVCYVAAIVIVAFYFEKKRSLATGIAVAGSGIGTFIFAPFIQHLIENWGWRGSLIILAGVFLNMCVCGMVMRDLQWTKKKAEKRSHGAHTSSRSGSTSHSSESLSDDEESGDCRHSCPPISELRKILQSGDITQLLSPDDSPTKFMRSSSMLLLPTFLSRTQTLPLDFIPCLNSRANAFEIVSQMYPHLLSSSLSEQMDILPPMLSDTRLHMTKNLDPVAAVPDALEKNGSGGPPTHRSISAPTGHQDNRISSRNPETNQSSDLRSKFTETADTEVDNLPGDLSRKASLASEKHEVQLHETNGNSSTGAGDSAPLTSTYNGACVGARSNREVTSLYTATPLYNMKISRQSMTYRGAMMNIHRYKLRASSCPDIYRNSMVTIEDSTELALQNLKDVLKDCTKMPYCTDPGYIIFSISNFILYLFYDTVYMYLVDYAIENGLDEDRSASLISIIGILNCIGMIGMGYIGDKEWYPLMIIYNMSMVMCGVAIIAMSVMTNFIALVVLAAVFGFFISANYALTSVILVDLISLDCFTKAYGFLLLTQGLANLFGPPFVGLMRDYTDDYVLPFVVSGVFIILSGLMLFLIPLFKSSAVRKKSYTPGTAQSDKNSDQFDSKVLIQPKKASHVIPGTVTHVMSGTVTHVMSGTATDEMPGTATDVMPGTATDVMPGTATDVMPGTATDVMPGTATDVMPGTATHVVPGTATDVVPGTATDVMPGTATRLLMVLSFVSVFGSANVSQ
ncbi:Major facilitator superfamily [Trinorchestia longiramus]|nr:Major facilitator superfamily [Trinorchestia longiramus]